MSDIFSLDNKVSVISGASGGLGSAIAKMFSEHGSITVLLGTNKTKLELLANEINQRGGKAEAIQIDVTDQLSVANMVKKVINSYGRIDILVNAHGINIRVPTVDMKLSDWKKVLDVNLMGTFILCQEVGRVMIKQRGGKIINISSTAAEIGYPWGYSAYSPSKAGINALTKTLAVEWGKYGINVNAIAPFFIRTELTEKFLQDPKVYDAIVGSIPMGRLGDVADVASAALFLASSASNWINGEILHLDGGRAAY